MSIHRKGPGSQPASISDANHRCVFWCIFTHYPALPASRCSPSLSGFLPLVFPHGVPSYDLFPEMTMSAFLSKIFCNICPRTFTRNALTSAWSSQSHKTWESFKCSVGLRCYTWNGCWNSLGPVSEVSFLPHGSSKKPPLVKGKVLAQTAHQQDQSIPRSRNHGYRTAVPPAGLGTIYYNSRSTYEALGLETAQGNFTFRSISVLEPCDGMFLLPVLDARGIGSDTSEFESRRDSMASGDT